MISEYRSELARRLVRSDCRYAVCGGVDASRWEADFDVACTDPAFNPTDERFVMTTSHGNDADDAAFFFANCTSFDEHDFRDHLILVVAGDVETEQRLLDLVERHAHRPSNSPS